MIQVKVSILGTEKIIAAFTGAPERLNASLFAATVEATELARKAVEDVTPVWDGRVYPGGHQPGVLRGSIQGDVVKTSTGFTGTVHTDTSYARFVEFGTLEHGRAQRMFYRGVEASKPGIHAIFENSVSALVDSFG